MSHGERDKYQLMTWVEVVVIGPTYISYVMNPPRLPQVENSEPLSLPDETVRMMPMTNAKRNMNEMEKVLASSRFDSIMMMMIMMNKVDGYVDDEHDL